MCHYSAWGNCLNALSSCTKSLSIGNFCMRLTTKVFAKDAFARIFSADKCSIWSKLGAKLKKRNFSHYTIKKNKSKKKKDFLEHILRMVLRFVKCYEFKLYFTFTLFCQFCRGFQDSTRSVTRLLSEPFRRIFGLLSFGFIYASMYH